MVTAYSWDQNGMATSWLYLHFVAETKNQLMQIDKIIISLGLHLQYMVYVYINICYVYNIIHILNIRFFPLY